MNKSAADFPVWPERPRGNRVWDIDGFAYLDFALGDTGAMAGHSPEATVAAIQHCIATLGGTTAMRCYHGSVDESLIVVGPDGERRSRP